MSACKRAGSPDGLRRFRYFIDRSLNGIAVQQLNRDRDSSKLSLAIARIHKGVIEVIYSHASINHDSLRVDS